MTQTRTHNINSRTISGKNHTSIISQSSQPKELTFTNIMSPVQRSGD